MKYEIIKNSTLITNNEIRLEQLSVSKLTRKKRITPLCVKITKLKLLSIVIL